MMQKNKSLCLDECMDRVTLLANIELAQEDESITELFIRDILVDPLIAAALTGLLSLERFWERIVLYHVRAKVEKIVRAAMRMDNVECFRLAGLPQVNHSFIFDLGDGISRSRRLKKLSLFPFELTANDATILAEGLEKNRTLEECNLGGFPLEIQSITAIARSLSLNKNFRVLRLDGCSLGDHHVVLLVSYLVNCNFLEELSLERNAFCSDGIHAIRTLLELNKVERLRLSYQRIPRGARVDLSHLAIALPRNTSLKILELRSNNINDYDLEILALALRKNSTLQCLNVSRNDITDLGVSNFAQYVHEMTGLRKLFLGGNPFGNFGAQQLLSAVKCNSELEDVRIPVNTHVMKQLQEHICFYLRINMGGRRLLRATNVPLSVWPVMLGRAIRMYRRLNGDRSSWEEGNFIFNVLKGPILLER